MKKLRDVILLLLLAGFGVRGEAQVQNSENDDVLYGEITGRVLDAATREPLPFVNVFLDSTRLGTTTANDGSFLLRQVPPGKYHLHLSRLGYDNIFVADLTLMPGKLLARDFIMHESPLAGEEIMVTAARKEQTAQMAPASVAILNAAELKYRQIATFDQALETVPGVSVMRAASTNVQSLSIRGSSDVAGGGVGNRVLLLIDGRPALSSDAGGALWSLVPTNFIDRVEIVKGAFSSLYGSTAMGGVVNVITRRPTYNRQTRVEASYGRYELPTEEMRHTDTPGYLSSLALSHSGREKQLSYLLNFSRKQSSGFRERTAYEFYDLYGKLLYDFRQNRNLEVSLGATSARNDYPHTWRDNLQPYRVIPRYQDDRQEKLNYNADVFYWAVPSPRVKYSSRFYFYRNAAQSFFNESDPNWRQTRNDSLGLRTDIDAD
ncbi:TonB-dependent receptor, partial [candidate division KSB1 bacterium]|nr:TonB-dependent receptor [candidate division KSB1 bacterium]